MLKKSHLVALLLSDSQEPLGCGLLGDKVLAIMEKQIKFINLEKY